MSDRSSGESAMNFGWPAVRTSARHARLAEARRAYESAQRVLDDAQRQEAEADTAAAEARKVYEELLGKNEEGQQIRANTGEAELLERRLEADRARARELFEAAGKPVPAWLR